jgi:hypothetical protein
LLDCNIHTNHYLFGAKMTQQELIIKCLKKGWKSPLDALKEAGTMKLATRVGELRKAGCVIIDKWHPTRAFKLYKMVKYAKSTKP